jgi:hypothetical protein
MAKLTTKARKKIPTSEFAGPDRSYPIADKSHARNALARASGKPVEARVRAAVKRKYPDIGQEKDPVKRKSRLDSWAKGRREKP